MKKIFVFACILISVLSAQTKKHTFSLGNDNFLLDGKPFQIISGEMHFARIPREYWRDRLRMAKAMGLNTIATYVFWNYHEPEKGKYNFKGNADVTEFVRIAQQEGLWVLIRPSAYACAEWEFGGYPYWLLNEKDLKVRNLDPNFIALMKGYFKELGRQLAPLQVTNGGPILMVQVENEYGSYGSDKKYLEMNEKIMRNSGFNVPFYTCDGADKMTAGCINSALPAINGLDNVKEVKDVVNKNNSGKGPYFIAEWYPAWFDEWGQPHHTVPPDEYARRLDTVLANGISINIYMEHGGTTRGFMNGANYDDDKPYAPQTSSYDYDAPIDEAGNATPKYYAFRKVIEKYMPVGTKLPNVPANKKAISIPAFKLNWSADITQLLPKAIHSESPLTFEQIKQAYGYVFYQTKVSGQEKSLLRIPHLSDYAIIFINGKKAACLDRRLNEDSCFIMLNKDENTLDIFIENMGRINYGKYLNDNYKGITHGVFINGKEIKGWDIYGFPFNKEPDISSNEKTASEYPTINQGSFNLSEVGDTYLDMRNWYKGHVWINGHNLGRYWYIGPQQTIYVPACWLKKGENKIVVFEQFKFKLQNKISAIDKPILNEGPKTNMFRSE
jgi:beta-galactosidase